MSQCMDVSCLEMSAQLLPEQIAQQPSRQQGEQAGRDAGAEIELAHDAAVMVYALVAQVPEGKQQATQSQRHQQVNRGETAEIGRRKSRMKRADMAAASISSTNT